MTFEGGEGAGKSTQVAALAAALHAAGHATVTSREPGGTPGGEAIRALLVEGPEDRWSPMAEALLHTAARTEHVERWLRPQLAQSAFVLVDRFADSTRVYQGLAGGLGLEPVDQLQRLAFGGLEPDLTLLLDLPVEVGLARASRAGAHHRHERMGRAYHERVRSGFLALAEAAPHRFVVIEAAAPMAAVTVAVRRAMSERFGLDLAPVEPA